MVDRRLVFVVNHVAFFVSHRLPVALAAREAGYDVLLVTGQAGSPSMEASAVESLRVAGIRHRRVSFRSGGVNPIAELKGLVELWNEIRRARPSVVHCVSPKGILYGGLVARVCRVPALVLAVSGMGYAFTGGAERKLGRSLLRAVFSLVSRFVLGHPNLRVIVQNWDDAAAVQRGGAVDGARVTLLRGSGVRIEDFASATPERKDMVVLFPARMLRDKGLLEFVQAARALKERYPEWRFVLAGAADYDNPSAISAAQLDGWQRQGFVEWTGHVDDMRALYASAAIVCLPSYREGMPKVLLEAAAAGCAVVTTNAIGCREAIVPGETGDLVPVGDPLALAEALGG